MCRFMRFAAITSMFSIMLIAFGDTSEPHVRAVQCVIMDENSNTKNVRSGRECDGVRCEGMTTIRFDENVDDDGDNVQANG